MDVDNEKIRIAAVMSLPRLTFSDNMFCIVRTLSPLKIPIERGTGVFWSHALTRMMEKHLDNGTEYILAIDYDTFFTLRHLYELLRLVMCNPNVDAVVPLQIRRENDFCLFVRTDENDNPVSASPKKLFEQDLTEAATGHFGFTIIRTAALRKLKKPWFMPVPDSEGSWGEGRKDEDIYFWNNFAESGCRMMLAPKVRVGHLQMMATFPGRLEDDFMPVHCYMSDVIDGKIPEWCLPVIT